MSINIFTLACPAFMLGHIFSILFYQNHRKLKTDRWKLKTT